MGPTLQDVVRETKAKRAGSGWLGYCPCHDDKSASLSITAGQKQAVVVDCKAGCDWRDIKQQLGISGNGAAQPIVTQQDELLYDYTDADGRLLYQVVRKPPKQFSQRRPNGQGGWIADLTGVERVPYKLPDLIEGIALGKTVYVPEGEKDCESLRSYGLTATTNSNGAAWKWTAPFAEHFRSADVVVLPDNDDGGRAHADEIVRALNGVARSVRVLNLPGLREKGDVTDWLLAGNTVSELERLAQAAPIANPVSAATKSRFVLLDDLEIAALPQPEWLIESVIPSGALVLLVGPPKSYKSFVALDWACHVVLGLEWHSKRVRRGGVVYVYAEGATGLTQRVAAWKKYAAISDRLGVLFLPRRVILNDVADADSLIAAIHARTQEPPVLVIVDTVNRNMTGNENATEDMSGFVRGCDTIRESMGATVLAVHHTAKTGEKEGRGSSVLPAAADTLIRCDRDGERVTLECVFQKDAPEFGLLAMEALPIAPSLALKPSGLNAGGLKGQRLHCLLVIHLDFGEKGTSHSSWLKNAELGRSSFNKAVGWLGSNGYVKKVGGRWVLSDVGRSALSVHQSTVSPPPVHSDSLVQSTHGGVYKTPVVDLVDQAPTPLPSRLFDQKVVAA